MIYWIKSFVSFISTPHPLLSFECDKKLIHACSHAHRLVLAAHTIHLTQHNKAICSISLSPTLSFPLSPSLFLSLSVNISHTVYLAPAIYTTCMGLNALCKAVRREGHGVHILHSLLSIITCVEPIESVFIWIYVRHPRSTLPPTHTIARFNVNNDVYGFVVVRFPYTHTHTFAVSLTFSLSLFAIRYQFNGIWDRLRRNK